MTGQKIAKKQPMSDKLKLSLGNSQPKHGFEAPNPQAIDKTLNQISRGLQMQYRKLAKQK